MAIDTINCFSDQEVSKCWHKETLAEVAEPISQTHNFVGIHKVIFINTGDILAGKFLHRQYTQVSGLPGQAKKRIVRNDILFSEIRPINKRHAFVDFDDTSDYVVSTKLMVIRAKARVLPEFLYRVLISNEALTDFQHIAESRSGTFPQITFDAVKSYLVPVPPLNEQKAIVKMLSALDAKIEINHQMNKTFEAIAQTLFKEWFVEFKFPGHDKVKFIDGLPEEWQNADFGEIVSCVRNQVQPGEHLSKRYYVPIECMPMNQVCLSEYKSYLEAQSSLITFEEGDILFGAMRAYFHRVNYAPFAGVTRTTVFVLRPKKEHWLSYSLCLMNLDDSVEYANAHSKGSTMPYAVWENSLEKMPAVLPPDGILVEFERMIRPLIKAMNSNAESSRVLTQIRDSILPKLMFGPIQQEI